MEFYWIAEHKDQVEDTEIDEDGTVSITFRS